MPRASCQIRKIAGCACAGNAGNVFPAADFQGNRQVSYPGMHHGTFVTHVPWCMSGSLTSGGGENVPGIPGACATFNFTYLARGPWTDVCFGELSHYRFHNASVDMRQLDFIHNNFWFVINKNLHEKSMRILSMFRCFQWSFRTDQMIAALWHSCVIHSVLAIQVMVVAGRWCYIWLVSIRVFTRQLLSRVTCYVVIRCHFASPLGRWLNQAEEVSRAYIILGCNLGGEIQM